MSKKEFMREVERLGYKLSEKDLEQAYLAYKELEDS